MNKPMTNSYFAMDTEKQCLKCEEFWPNDKEFFKTESSFCCIACEKEINRIRPLQSIFTIPKPKLEKQMQACITAKNRAKDSA